MIGNLAVVKSPSEGKRGAAVTRLGKPRVAEGEPGEVRLEYHIMLCPKDRRLFLCSHKSYHCAVKFCLKSVASAFEEVKRTNAW